MKSRLEKAAPVMLAALKIASETLTADNFYFKTLRYVDAAIAKATGGRPERHGRSKRNRIADSRIKAVADRIKSHMGCRNHGYCNCYRGALSSLTRRLNAPEEFRAAATRLHNLTGKLVELSKPHDFTVAYDRRKAGKAAAGERL